MTTEIITATIHRIERMQADSGDPACSIVLKYDDGTKFNNGKVKGKMIWQWLWLGEDLRDNQKIDIKQWAALIDHDGDFDSAKEIIAGQSWAIIGVKVDLQVDTEPKFWKIINFGKEGTLQQAATSPPADEIPF